MTSTLFANKVDVTFFCPYAYGTPTADSDVDLLVLMKGRRVYDKALRIREAVDFNFAVDLIVRSPEEFERRIGWGDGFLKEIRENGKVLYEAAVSTGRENALRRASRLTLGQSFEEFCDSAYSRVYRQRMKRLVVMRRKGFV